MESTVIFNEVEGKKYFCIYEVRAVKKDGEVIISDRFLDERHANEHCEFIYSHLRSLYEIAFVRKQWVWC